MTNTRIPRGKLLTVAVPVYNTVEYLGKCIESIINQQYKHLDIILIDDGSTDGSGELCDVFSQIDDRIRVFHGKNRGLVESRKIGADLAKGDLITFVDSDDWIQPEMYFYMMNAYIEFEPDMVTSGITIENGRSIRYEIDKIPEGLYEYKAIREKIIPCMMYDESAGERGINSSVCNKIYKTELFKKMVIELESGLTYGEDAAITYLCIAKASKIMILSKSWYHYIIHSDSMVNSYNIRSFEKIHRFYNYMKRRFSELGLWGHMEMQVKEYTKTFFFRATQEVFDNLIENSIYLFPFELIEKGSRVAIYGAGKVGSSYRESILKSGYANLYKLVDNDYVKLNSEKYLVESPHTLKNEELDYVIIAIKNEKVALGVKDFLNGLGIEQNKILWKPPIKLNGRI